MFNRKTVVATLVAATAAFAATASFAGEWGAHHPRRAEVNRRLENQGDRIHREVKEGEMTKTQAHQLRQDDRQIRQEERDMASQDGGHITKADRRVLNQQENGISRQIGQ